MRIQIRINRNPASSPLTLAPSRIRVAARPMRVLDFDVEARPLHFYGDYVSKEITAMAWAWTDVPEDVTCYLLGEVTLPEMLERFRAAYVESDMVTGHYILGFDLPLVTAMLTEMQLPLLPHKLAHDTKIHLVKRHGLSGSQENIGSMLGLSNPKVGMNQTTWRAANRLTAEGLAEVKTRVIGDVKQHIEMRKRLLELGYLSGPTLYKSGTTKTEPYAP